MTLVIMLVGGQKLELDVCCSCHVQWFDPNELDVLHKSPPPTFRELLKQSGNKQLPLERIAEAVRPVPAVPSIYDWQRKNIK